jgi:hypothetical protein
MSSNKVIFLGLNIKANKKYCWLHALPQNKMKQATELMRLGKGKYTRHVRLYTLQSSTAERC